MSVLLRTGIPQAVLALIIALSARGSVGPSLAQMASGQIRGARSAAITQVVEPKKAADSEDPIFTNFVFLPAVASNYDPSSAPIGVWPDGTGVDYTPDVTPDYFFVDEHRGVQIIRASAVNNSFLARFHATDNDITHMVITNDTGTVNETVTDFVVEALDTLPPGYPEGTVLYTYTMRNPVEIPVTYGDVVSAISFGQDGSRYTLSYEIQPSIEDIVKAQIDGLGAHGAVIDLEVRPEHADQMDLEVYFDEHEVTVDVSQGGDLIQESVLVEEEGGAYFVELVDFALKLNETVDAGINVSRNGDNHTEQVSIAGLVQYPPSIMPLFHQSDLDEFGVTLDYAPIHDGEPPYYYAVDFCGNSCVPGEGAEITGLPIYLQEMRVIRLYCTNTGDGCDPDENINAYLYDPRSGLSIFITHVQPTQALIDLVNPGRDTLPDDFYSGPWPGDPAYTLDPDVAYFTVGDSGAGHETETDHLHYAAQVPYPFVSSRVSIPASAVEWNESTGISHGPPAYFGVCTRLDGEPGYGVGPCPEEITEENLNLGTLFVHTPLLLNTGFWVDTLR